MQKPKKEPEVRDCTCGRSVTEAAVSTYRSHSVLFTFHRCECGLEWTERFSDVDRNEPISGDELLAVHQVLLSYEGSLPDLLQQAFA